MKRKANAVLAIDWRTKPRRTVRDVARVLAKAEAPLKMWQVGWLLGLFRYSRRRGYAGWGGCWIAAHGRVSHLNFAFVTRAMRELRASGEAVKLPHEFAQGAARYRACADHEHARALQLAACEELLVKATGAKRRALLCVLDGLRPRADAPG